MLKKMPSPKTRKIAGLLALAAVSLIALVAYHLSSGVDGTARAQFLRFVPADATSVFFVDLDELRGSPFLAALYSWAPQPAEDSEYAQFVRDTGFHYESDLAKAFIAVSNRGDKSTTLALAEGKFDQSKIEAYLIKAGKAVRQGSLKVYVLPGVTNEKPLCIALLSTQRIAITNDENLFSALSDAVRQGGHSEWQKRFDRLRGSPAFAVIRQDPAVEAALGSVAPGGFRSPQLAVLINQLQWISIAAKPESGILRLVADGESSSDATSSQLRDFLEGIQLLAQDGLNDAKLRQQMKPEEREAYLELLKSADVQKIDRGDFKSVRLVLSVTPQFLTVANRPHAAIVPGRETGSSREPSRELSQAHAPKSAKKK